MLHTCSVSFSMVFPLQILSLQTSHLQSPVGDSHCCSRKVERLAPRGKVRIEAMMGEFEVRQAGSSKEVKDGKETGGEGSPGESLLEVGSKQTKVPNFNQ